MWLPENLKLHTLLPLSLLLVSPCVSLCWTSVFSRARLLYPLVPPEVWCVPDPLARVGHEKSRASGRVLRDSKEHEFRKKPEKEPKEAKGKPGEWGPTKSPRTVSGWKEIPGASVPWEIRKLKTGEKKLFRVVGNRISSLRGYIRKYRGQRDTEIYRIYRSKQKCTFSQLCKLETPDQHVVWVGFFQRFLSLAYRLPSFACLFSGHSVA